MPDARNHEGSRTRELFFVFSFYFVLSCIMTWPLAAGITRDVPGDLGDSLLNMWILGWGAENLPRVVTGQLPIREFWNANIFHPDPLTLSLSETLFGQVLQILPVYHFTGNLILCYNLLFLSTFALSGLGMYLLVREFTSNRWAALVAGLLFAFVPYRIGHVGHIQTLSSQWMPFALYGFRRYITTSSLRALAGGAAALVMQNLSCGYFLIYFTPVVVLFVLHQIVASGRACDWRLWFAFTAAAMLVIIGTAPVLVLYLEGRKLYGLQRPAGEILSFSADVYGYLTPPEALKFLGSAVRLFPKAENDLFPGLVVSSLAIIGLVGAVRDARHDTTGTTTWFRQIGGRGFSLRAALTLVIGIVAIALAVGLIGLLFTGGFVISVAGIPIRANDAPRIFGQLLIALAALVALSAKLRRVMSTLLASPVGIAAALFVFTVWMSFGPALHVRGQPVADFAFYQFFLNYVPGFSGLRVPARYAMIAMIFLTWLAGHGAARLLNTYRPRGVLILGVAALSIGFLAEAWFAPMVINATWAQKGITPPARVEPSGSAPPVYRYLKTLPNNTVVVEFPFGDQAWELRYVYYSTVHWKRLVNGYSGAFPSRYQVLVAHLDQMQKEPEAAWQALRLSAPTHAIVHERALRVGEAQQITSWLTSHGFREIGRFSDDVLYSRI